ncbi:hypothetical protein RSAG8_10760, partial [Rhizoctonia solani AG-8 WAC10335]
MRRFPSMFDAHVNMELSQHLFDIQMARYMRVAGEILPTPAPQAIVRPEQLAQPAGTSTSSDEVIPTTNNAGTGADAARACQVPRSMPGVDMNELMERSNQLAERFNQLLERSNEIAEQHSQPMEQSSSHTFAEQINQVLERLTQLFEQSHLPAARTDHLVERFNQLFERFNQLAEQSYQPAQRANELAERSNELAARANQLAEQLNQYSERSNQLSEQANKSGEQAGDVLGNINRVLVGIQHATVRSRQGNTFKAADCLINEKGDTLGQSMATQYATFEWLSDQLTQDGRLDCELPIMIEGLPHTLQINDTWLGEFLRFFGVGNQCLESGTSTKLKDGHARSARIILARYLSSCLG